MDKLVTHVAAEDVTDEFKELAMTWPLWDSGTHPQTPPKSGKFHFDYNGDYASERVLIMSGRATLTPDDGSPPIEIAKGDQVFFHKGFACNWRVTERMTKHYAYFDEEGKEMEPVAASISCDVCGAECWEESYLTKDEEDICPECYKADRKLYQGAEHQKFGEAFVPEAVNGKRSAPESNGHAKKVKSNGDAEDDEDEEDDEDDEEEDGDEDD